MGRGGLIQVSGAVLRVFNVLRHIRPRVKTDTLDISTYFIDRIWNSVYVLSWE